MAVRALVQTAVTFGLGCFFGSLVMLRALWGIVRQPKRAFYVKDRREPPACLGDSSLGTHGYIHLEKVRLHYVANGEEGKPLMLFVHGFPEFWYSWRYQLKEFAKDYRCVAIDQRGYNDSDKPTGVGNYAMSMMVDDLKQLIPALGYKSCVLVGHDWGGAVCWAFASQHQYLIDRLILMNCPHPGSFFTYAMSHPSQFLKSWYIYFFQLPWLPELAFRLNDYQNIVMTFKGKKMGVQSGIMTNEDIEAYKYAFSRPGAATASINYYRAAVRSVSHDKRVIEKPTQIIWGCVDVALERGLAEECREFTKDLSISYIEEASHWVQMDQPDKVNKLMRKFLEEKS
ncbi:hypothetical protein SNE40_005080 [Patella caerulea]|uniref:AB hydrolase-1 domain-containing protein n=1 Tax=Patella caerulea TaxID=87958 RepID=A0AAN8JZE2_PATCE